MGNSSETGGRHTYEGYRVTVRLVREGSAAPVRIGGAADVYRFFQELGGLDREVFYSLHLDARNQVVGCEEVSKGCLSQSLVHPREVYKAAILSSAASIIVTHNHPSGLPEPSPEDHAINGRLYRAGDLLGIPLLDSVIIGDGRFYSAREHRAPPWGDEKRQAGA